MKKTISYIFLLSLIVILFGCFNKGETYTVSFLYNHDNMGEYLKVKEINKGSLLSEPKKPTVEGYSFDGWFKDESCLETSKWIFTEMPVENDISLYAKWVEKTLDELLYDELFSEESKVSFDLDMDHSEWLKMQDDYNHYNSFNAKSPIYRKANYLKITLNGDTYQIDDVGVRMKGNTSRTDFYNDANGFYNLIHLKLSFQETFDDEDYYDNPMVFESDEKRAERKNRTFAGLAKIDMKWNKNLDNTYIREIYALEMFRDYGIYAPNASLCDFKTTNKDIMSKMGVFIFYETVDKDFLERHKISDTSGDLYKCAWKSSYTETSSIGVEDDDKGLYYAYDLKTNKKKSTHQDLINLITSIKADSSIDNLANLIDLDYFYNFEAVNFLVGNPDCIRNNYNNHYVYFNNHKAIFMPYDYDRVFGLNKDWNPASSMLLISPTSIKTAANSNNTVNPIYFSILKDASAKKKLTDKIVEVAASKWFTFDHFKSYYDKYQANYSSSTTPDISFNNCDSRRLSFDINQGTTNIESTSENITFLYYISNKRIKEYA
ncbi:CotH kinase family protein [Acholeplasma sp. OttesenSCG-928-E16]|nr:CotH kinase family protein [Acholeplasma sp. OttesenSCG-928-E16]